MLTRIATTTVIVLMVLNGLLFVSNIYVLGDTPAAIAMHDDLAPDAGAFMAQGKVLNCFISGILYLIAAWGFIRRRDSLALYGVIGAAFFIGFYLVELVLWGTTHTRVWLDFSVFGGLSLVLGLASWRRWRGGWSWKRATATS